MSALSTADRVRKIIAEQLHRQADQLEPEASLIGDLGADSLDTVEVVIAIEDEFGVDISDDLAETWQTVGHYVSGTEKLIGALAVTA